jgi:hypothetical protein
MEILMTSYSIIPNIALGMGVILIIQTVGITYEIPCHNAATAEHLKRSHQQGAFALVDVALR